jgi:hypothetical protein
MRFLLLLIGSLVLLSGCAGSAELTPAGPRADYYSGTLTFLASSPFGSSVSDVIANQGPEGIELLSTYPSVATLSPSAEGYFLQAMGAVLPVDLHSTATSSGLRLLISSEGQAMAIAELAAASFPHLGQITNVPAAGHYEGEFLVISNGKPFGFGTVAADVAGDGTWNAITSGVGAWLDGTGFFGGAFQPSGALREGYLLINGSYINQADPRFSFDGETLIVRYDQLPLEPGSIWMTVRRVGSEDEAP